MPVNPNMLEATKQSAEYQKGLEILGQPDDYATQIMVEFIGFFYIMTIRHEGSIEELDAFVRELGVTPVKNSEENYTFHFEDEEALTALFTYIVGRTSKEYFEEFLKLRAQNASEME